MTRRQGRMTIFPKKPRPSISRSASPPSPARESTVVSESQASPSRRWASGPLARSAASTSAQVCKVQVLKRATWSDFRVAFDDPVDRHIDDGGPGLAEPTGERVNPGQ